jgi:hypothetical protein
MPFALVQETDAALRGLATWQGVFRKAKEVEEKSKAFKNPEYGQELETTAKDTIKKSENGYGEVVMTIHANCNVPLLTALITRILDLALGPLQWMHVFTFYAILAVYTLLRKQRPSSPIIIVAIFSIMPFIISGTSTRLIGALFGFDTIYSPLAAYIHEDISDRTEVRFVLIGILLDFIYFSAAALLSTTASFIPIFLAFISGYAAIGLAVFLIFSPGPWDKFFRTYAFRNTGSSFEHPLSRFLVETAKYAIQLLLFPLNRAVRSVAGKFSRLNPPENVQYPQGLEPYVYKNLQGERLIRLLRIPRKVPFQMLQCRFEYVEIGLSEEFEAISYVWGNPARTRSIFVDGGRLDITKSAYDIIHRRQSAWHDQLIWIDQVCINQDDNDEKASQVQMMEQIYKSAIRVTAYLGEATDAHLVQRFLATLHHKTIGLGISPEQVKASYISNSKRPEWDALARFLKNEYFQRVWIIQEAAFARELHLLYGNICMDWEYVSRGVAVLSNRHMLESLVPSGSLHDSITGLNNIDTIIEFRGDIIPERVFDLALVLKTCSSFKSTDQRDKVYAVLGLTVDDSKKVIKPRYDDKHLASIVYTNAMSFILLEAAHPLNALSQAGIGWDRSMKNLPSWVPDWSHTDHVQNLNIFYSASTQYRPCISFDREDRSIIHLDGLQFDQVELVKGVNRANSRLTAVENASIWEKWFVEAEALARAHARDPYHNGEPLMVAFIRTMLGNQTSYNPTEHPSVEECYRDYAAVQLMPTISDVATQLETLTTLSNADELVPLLTPESLLTQIKDTSDRTSKFLHWAGAASSFRRFCVTKQKRMAIVPPHCLQGDVICVIKGARMPYILRKRDGKRQLYDLVGCCYVHGAMDGQIRIEKAETLAIA